MKTRTYWALGVLVLIIIVVGVCYWGGKPSVETADTVDTPSKPEQVAVQASEKMPPLGESYATGHWEGDVWKRTVPPEPETLMHEGKPMTLYEFLMTAFHGNSWEERVAILNRVIAEAPYSDEAYTAREFLARSYDNGDSIFDDALLFERLQPMVAYHPDNPYLLYDLLRYGKDVNPEAAIHYGKEALKYKDRIVERHFVFPEGTHLIHAELGHPYQLIGDYSSAVLHYKRCVELLEADPGRDLFWKELATEHIELILSGNPVLGPLARQDSKSADAAPDAVSESASVESEVVTDVPLEVPGAVPFLDADDDDLPMDTQQREVDPRDLAKRAAAERYQQVQQRAKQAQQRFDTFMKQLHQIATIKTEADFEKFLTQELTKRLKGTKSSSEASNRPAVSADRMRRASQIFRKAQNPAEGMKKLQEVDPKLAETLRRDPR